MIADTHAARPEALTHAAVLGSTSHALQTALAQARAARLDAARLRAALRMMGSQLGKPPAVGPGGEMTPDPEHVLYSQTERATVQRAAFARGLPEHPGDAPHVTVPAPDWARVRTFIARVLAGNDAQVVIEDMHAESVQADVVDPAVRTREDLYNLGHVGSSWQPVSEQGPRRSVAASGLAESGRGAAGAAPGTLMPPIPAGRVPSGRDTSASGAQDGGEHGPAEDASVQGAPAPPDTSDPTQEAPHGGDRSHGGRGGGADKKGGPGHG